MREVLCVVCVVRVNHVPHVFCQVRTWLPSFLVSVWFLLIPTVTTANFELGNQVR